MFRPLSLLFLICLIVAPLTAAEPRRAPAFEFSLLDGTTVSLDEYKGKVVLLEFILTTCSHCARTSGFLQKLYDELGPKGFQPLAVAFNDFAKDVLPQFAEEAGMHFTAGTADREKVQQFLNHREGTAMYTPQIVFIDRQGNIRGQYGGIDAFLRWGEEANIRATVEKLLAEQ